MSAISADRGDARRDDGIGHKLRLRRKLKGLSLQDVAGNSGISIGQLSQIERGLSAPSLKSLKQICTALDMPMGWLFDGIGEARGDDDGVIVRQENRRHLDLGSKGMSKELMTPDSCPGIQMMQIVIRPGGSSGDQPYNNPEGAKCGTVVEGRLGIEIDGRAYYLDPGDTFAFDARSPHRFWCASETSCRLLWVVAPALY